MIHQKVASLLEDGRKLPPDPQDATDSYTGKKKYKSVGEHQKE
jgi:hypothetical protein